MIIDCHGHYTTAPDALGAYRERQKAELADDPHHGLALPRGGHHRGDADDHIGPLPGLPDHPVRGLWRHENSRRAP